MEDPAVEDGIEAEVDENLGGDEEIDLLNEEPVRNVLDNNAVEDSAFKDFFTELSADAKAIEGEHTVYTEDNVFEQHSDDTVEIDYTNESDAVEVGELNIIGLNEKAHIEENTDVFCEKEVPEETVDDIETPFSKDFIDEDIGTPDSDAFDFDKSNLEDDKSVHRQLDEADIILALALGDKEHIETSIGFVKVREAKHNFVNPQERALHSTSATIHRKSEYKASDEDGEIKDAYRKEKKSIAWRFGTTAFVWLLLVFSELIISFESIYVPYVSEFLASPISYHIVSILLSVVAVAISVKKMLLGVVGFITNRPNYYTTVSVVAVINFVYSILIVTAFGDSGMMLLNSVVVLGILLNIVGEYMHLVRETLTFKLISNPNPKISLEKFDKTPETVKKEDFLTGSDFYIESVASVGKYFERSAHRPESYHVRHAYMMITVLLSLLVSVIAVAVTNNFAYFLFACELSALLCIPTEFGVVGALPFFIISGKLYKLDSAIIGETIDDEYIGPNTVYMDDVEVFGNHGVRVINLEPHNGFNIVNVNYYFHSVFSGLKCPLKNAFGEIPAEMKISDNVSLVNVSDSGIEAVVDENCEVLIGTRNFMEENSVIVSKSTDAKASEKADVCVMYMAVNGALCAKMYLKYSINHHFEKFASDMTESHIRIGVRTLDPNVTSEMLGTL
ncbi:MAG: hypothetical protein IJW79_09900, partial [Clostridia bacterium]|nr:hypothetical protein [Clostridia bacterium]